MVHGRVWEQDAEITRRSHPRDTAAPHPKPIIYNFRNRSIAASSVASFLAKHSRARRWPGGGVS